MGSSFGYPILGGFYLVSCFCAFGEVGCGYGFLGSPVSIFDSIWMVLEMGGEGGGISDDVISVPSF